MIEPYELFLTKRAVDQLKGLRGQRRRAAWDLIDDIAGSPSRNTSISFEDRKGRIIEKESERGIIVTFHVDHAIREVKVMNIERKQ